MTYTKTGEPPVFEPEVVPYSPAKSAGKAGFAVLTTWIAGAVTIFGAVAKDPDASALLLQLLASHKALAGVATLIQFAIVFYRDKSKHDKPVEDEAINYPPDAGPPPSRLAGR
jgi:hypothetical protein